MAKVHQKVGKRTMMLGCQVPGMHAASHRTPVWWTGDNLYDQLALGVQQTVDAGVLDLKPYVHQDCAGHHGPGLGMTTLPDGSPNPWGHLGTLPYPGEVYGRWLQYCALGTITRIHSAPSMSRLPWKFGAEAEKVARQFLLMRRTLAPTLVAAARQAHLDGTPIVRRCDLVWPQHAAEGANSSAQ
jgi:alpha-glucosidase (family GH31 glycosyl hydrolase)